MSEGFQSAATPPAGAGEPPAAPRVAVSGASGLIGSRLVPVLARAGWQTQRLVRTPGAHATDEIAWEPARGAIDAARLRGVSAVVHLAGESLAGGRWTEARRAAIRDSRVQGTRLVARTLAALEPRPRVLIAASAVGYYGNRSAELLTEESPAGLGFLAETCRAWEDATQPARAAGIRVVNVRLGVVLAREGGALRQMLLPFRLGLGAQLGHGRQYMSWIAADDVTALLTHLLTSDALSGPVNATAPAPVTNAAFTRTLAGVLGRPAWLRAPAPLLRAVFGGGMAREALLASTRAVPQKLLAAGYRFQHPDLAAALRAELGG